MTTIDAIFFDLDGTLLDTLADLAAAGNAALEQLGHPTHSVDAYRYFVGNGMANLAARILPDDVRNPDTSAVCLQRVREAYAKGWDRSRPYEGIAEMLDALVAAGRPMAVLSNKPHDFTQLTVERLLPRWSFAAVQGVDAAVSPKPDPTGARLLLERLDLTADQVMMVGDTRMDMETGVNAGMIPVGVTWGFRDEAELRDHGARHIIHRPAELLDLVARDGLITP